MDASRFDEWVEPVRDRLYAAAYRVVGNEPDALDALQEALMRIHRALDQWDGRAAFGTWAHRIVVRCAIDGLDKRRRAGAPIEAAGEVADPRSGEAHEGMAQEERGEIVRRALDGLPERQRLVLNLRHYEDLPLAEIAQLLGIAEGTVKATLSQALRNLRSRLEAVHGLP